MPGSIDRSINLPELPKLPDVAVRWQGELTNLRAGLLNILDYLTKEREAIISAHDGLASAINDVIIALTPPAGATYAFTNVTTDRTVDANATTVDEVADALGTLIADLHARGII